MVNEIKHKTSQIRELCIKHRVKKLWLFGSALNDTEFREDSDVDFLYILHPIESGREYLDHLYGMINDLQKLLGRKVDFIEYTSFRNPYFKEEVESTKFLIYEHGRSFEEIPV